MLEFLRIQNLALIEDLELEFAEGINVLTGETGAGKSFILRAVNFLLGDKLKVDMVRESAAKAQVEAIFVQDGEELMIRRELSGETGRSRLFINDSLSSQNVVRELRERLVWHTSQHGQQRLLSPAYQAKLIDRFLPDQSVISQKDQLLAAMRDLLLEKQELDDRVRSLSERREMLEFQSAEIEKVDPQPGEEDDLLAQKKNYKDFARSAKAVEEALDALHGQGEGMLDQASTLLRAIQTLAAQDERWADEADACEDFRQRIMDMDARLRSCERPDTGYDQEQVESRLYALAQLKRKLNRSLDEIVNLRKEIDENLSFLDSCALDAKQLERREVELASRLELALNVLNDARQSAAKILCANLARDLAGLGFDKAVQVQIAFTPHEVYPGLSEDRARLLWIPNPGQAPQPLDQIASGGELSRFLLALVGLMTRESLPTLIFDEVDAGIGGLTLNAVGNRIQTLAAQQQVILITHWPQLAAKAACHFNISKAVGNGMTSVSCKRLSEPEIFSELSRMGGGGQQGEALARELLQS
ncbi:DNA repair protein RecN [Desulfovibrio ferrophilus]|uniref:DNA repair protein RecN n=1 Tax=Desulfovibrio ferrophilus TaxID=241368 RepID=A0A2Z6B346_9BACT|nr:AAA family ATPase [Desulfovibrio ferrophilus]BBD09939.1 DNA repair protein RecN [Desulfovibrio ferrophilus]